MATKAQIKARARQDLKIDPNGDIWSDTQIYSYIDDFIGSVYSEIGLDFKESHGTFTLVQGTATYDLGTSLTNYGKLTSLRLSGRTTLLDLVDKQSLQDRFDLTQQGEPVSYYYYGDQTIGLFPVPDGAITTMEVDFERNAPSLDTTESPAFSSTWHYVAALYASFRCLASMPGFESRARIAENDYNKTFSRMREDLWERSSSLTLMRNASNPICPQ